MTQRGFDYVTDTTYPAGYYREQAPHHMRLACLLNGMDCPRIDGRRVYLELGCGYGFVALVLAANNPDWHVIGIDLMPEHIRLAQDLAASAGISNVSFLVGDLSTFAEDPACRDLPPADFVSLHGLWSWVPTTVRAGVVRLLRTKLRPGGMVQISYNSLPGWQPAMGMQRVIREVGIRAPGSSDQQAMAGLQSVFQLMGAQAMHLAYSPFVHSMLNALNKSSVDYLAHEYMNGSWSPCFHGQVSADLAESGLNWSASANLMENLPELTLTDPQRTLVAQAEDIMLRELFKDMCLFRGFRNDIFQRGGTKLTADARSAKLEDIILTAREAAEAFSFDIFIPRPNVPRQPVTLSRAVYEPILEALAAGPRRVADLLALPAVKAGMAAGMMTTDNPAAELLAVLVGTNHAMPVAQFSNTKTERADRFNNLVAERLLGARRTDAGIAMATGDWGTPLPCTVLQAGIARLIRIGQPIDATTLASQLAPHTGEDSKTIALTISQIIERDIAGWKAIGLV